MPELLEVLVRGKMLTGWVSVSITRSIDSAAGAFEVSGPGRSPYPVGPGDPVQIYASGSLLLSGHVEQIDRSLTGRSSNVQFSGRDRSADLVDCTAKGSGWRNVDLVVLLQELASPYAVTVENAAGPRAAFDTFQVRPGETAWAAMERACRLRGVLMFPDGTGRLVIQEPGRNLADIELVEGLNLMRATFSRNDAERFAVYTVLGQRQGDDGTFADAAALVTGGATDSGARGGRELVIIAEATVDSQTAQERARWEATVRAARAVRVLAAAPGWRQAPDAGEGRLWTINEQVAVRSPSLDLDRYLLVRTLRLVQDSEGERAEFELVRQDAFQPSPDLQADDDPAAEWLQHTSALEAEPDDIELDQ